MTNRADSRPVLWFVSSLDQKGGGERFVLEAALAATRLGGEILIACERLGPEASFDGKYDLAQVVNLGKPLPRHAGYLRLAFSKLTGVAVLLMAVRRIRPRHILCQSEYDAIRLMLVSLLTGIPYRVFVFGQMFQFKTDISRYSSTFRSHLEMIVGSRPGYRETVTLPPPRLQWGVWLTNEIVSVLKYRALRRAEKVFVLSNQVRWEVSLLYGRDSTLLRGAIPHSAIRERPPILRTGRTRLLSVSRLVTKKRIDLILRALSHSKLDADLRIVGAGIERASLEQLRDSLGLADRIVFLGGVNDASLEAEYANAHAFVSMDIGDFDITVIEAMSYGIPVVVAEDFDMTAIGEDLPGVAVVKPDTASLAAALDAIPTMTLPNERTRAALTTITWEHLAAKSIG